MSEQQEPPPTSQGDRWKPVRKSCRYKHCLQRDCQAALSIQARPKGEGILDSNLTPHFTDKKREGQRQKVPQARRRASGGVRRKPRRSSRAPASLSTSDSDHNHGAGTHSLISNVSKHPFQKLLSLLKTPRGSPHHYLQG